MAFAPTPCELILTLFLISRLSDRLPSTGLRLDMDADDDLYNAKLLPPDRDPSTSITESIESSATTEFPSAKDAENTEKDGHWAWVVCGAAFCDLFVVLGMHYSVGVLYAALLDHFKESKAKTGINI